MAGFCATAKGCSYFPFSGSTLKTLAREVNCFDQPKVSLRFSATKPLPLPLIRRLIEVRIAEKKE